MTFKNVKSRWVIDIANSDKEKNVYSHELDVGLKTIIGVKHDIMNKETVVTLGIQVAVYIISFTCIRHCRCS